MELDEKLTSTFAALYSSLSEEDVKAMDFLLRVNFDHLWPKLEPLTAGAVLNKMMELGMWKVNVQLKECRLSSLMILLDKIGRQDLEEALKDFGW